MAMFIEPSLCSSEQLIFLTVVYGYVLYQSSNLIATGSEYLLFFPAVAGLVGSIVLPILGAVPDGVMVLFSGLGPDAQEQVSVGVGALAGSTVMLLTFPWFVAVLFGSAPIGEDGTAKFTSGDKGFSLSAGVTYQSSLGTNAKIMLATTILFLVIQIPASLQEMKTSDIATEARHENKWALGGIIACILAFVMYLVYCFKDANEDKVLATVIEGIKKKKISIGAALRFVKDTGAGSMEESLLPADKERMKKIIKPFFATLDVDKSGDLSEKEFAVLLCMLGEKDTPKATQMFQARDVDGNNKLCFEETITFLYTYLKDEKLSDAPQDCEKRYMPKYDEGDEEEEMPEDLADLPAAQQQKRLLFRSIYMMSLGTFLVLVFSDPMVDVLSDWGRRMSVSPFYVSFVLAPFASNASELLSAYTYAKKKSQKAITTALSTLIGAACMNNTFCLAIFLALVYFKHLAWKFTAETIAIVVIQWVIGIMTITAPHRTMRNITGVMILCLYPGCLFIVWGLENLVGLD